ncbi:MAG TPA: Hsp20 family protein [Sphingomicrobium sp.]|nr:Hsp20 family protein [Sphingomicrobium sp.]
MMYDFSPLYRMTVGFDRLFDMIDQVSQFEPMTNWPPYNVEKQGDDQYRITMAVAGFSPDEIEVTQQENTLVISGKKHQVNGQGEILHRGIATRAFKQSFNLADFVKVTEAKLENGLLTVALKREVPEELQPRRIPIQLGAASLGSGKPQQQIEHQKAA